MVKLKDQGRQPEKNVGQVLGIGSMRLVSELGLGQREHIAVVGGGGKTSLCFALAGELVEAGKKVITSTTTRVRSSEAARAPVVIFLPPGTPSYKNIEEGLRKEAHVFVAQGPAEPGKVKGVSPARADSLFNRLPLDYLIVEADGAAGLPLKAPADHEPVIPPSATRVVAVAGLEALGRPMDSSTVFRAEIFGRLTGLGQGDTITPEALSRVFLCSDGLFRGTPDGAEKTVFLNKLDLVSSVKGPTVQARLLLTDPEAPVKRVVMGSLLRKEYWGI